MIQHLHCVPMGKLNSLLLYHDMCWNFNSFKMGQEWFNHVEQTGCAIAFLTLDSDQWTVNWLNKSMLSIQFSDFDSQSAVQLCVLHDGIERRMNFALKLVLFHSTDWKVKNKKGPDTLNTLPEVQENCSWLNAT